MESDAELAQIPSDEAHEVSAVPLSVPGEPPRWSDAAVKRQHANRSKKHERRFSAVARCMRSATAAVWLFALGAFLSPSPAAACTDYGITESSRWSIRQTAGRPVLLTPCGDPFFSLGVNMVDGGGGSGSLNARAYRWDRFAPSLSGWARTTRRRLLEWGFNTAGAWSLAPRDIGLPSTPELDLGRTVQFVWQDPFEPALESVLKRVAADAVAPFRGEPLRIGYFSDNEIGWWNGPLFTAYMSAAPNNHTKRKLLALLRQHYLGSWEAFTRDFIPASETASFDDLPASRVAPRLRAGGHGIAAVRAWTRLFAAHYYQVMREALRAADPEALYLGDRVVLMGPRPGTIEEVLGVSLTRPRWDYDFRATEEFIDRRAYLWRRIRGMVADQPEFRLARADEQLASVGHE